MLSEAALTQTRAQIAVILSRLEPRPSPEWIAAFVDKFTAQFEADVPVGRLSQ
jgi:hypothetical protein